VLKHYVMKAYTEHGSKAPRILRFSESCRWVDSFTFRMAPGERTHSWLGGWLGQGKGWSWWRRDRSLPLPRNESQPNPSPDLAASAHDVSFTHSLYEDSVKNAVKRPLMKRLWRSYYVLSITRLFIRFPRLGLPSNVQACEQKVQVFLSEDSPRSCQADWLFVSLTSLSNLRATVLENGQQLL